MIARRGNPYLERPRLRVVAAPIASIVAGSAMVLFPVIATEPIVPPFGLMMLLSWRLLRPELWPVWIALPLGLADDLLSGHYLGTAMILWTAAFLVFEWIDQLTMWRDVWIEWALAAAAMILIGIGSWAFSQPADSATPLASLIPQTVAAILCFPAILRITALLDSWRLKR